MQIHQKNISRPWRIEFKDTVPQFQSYGKETVNLWKHLDKTGGICTFNEAVRDILHLRELYKQMDETVLNAYGWQDINLVHDFYEVDYLPENDRVRYTISPE